MLRDSSRKGNLSAGCVLIVGDTGLIMLISVYVKGSSQAQEIIEQDLKLNTGDEKKENLG